jgi:tetratricopeptide (TPR) repeat protein
VSYARQAGLKAAARSSNRAAVAYFEQSIDALHHLPASGETAALDVDLRLDLRGALLPLGDFARVLDVLREARGGAEALGDRRRQGVVEGFTSQSLSWAGDHAGAIAAGRHAMVAGHDLGDVALEVVATYRLAQFHLTVGELRVGADLARQALIALGPDRARERLGLAGLPAILARMVLTWCLAEQGAFRAAAPFAEEALGLAEAVDHAFDRVNACFTAGLLWLRQGDLARATPLLERGVRLSRTNELTGLFPSVAMSLGTAHVLAGRLADALPLLDEAVARHRALGVVGSRALFLVAQGEGYLLAGERERALEIATEALELSARFGERLYQAWSLRLLGAIAAAPPVRDPDAAEARYREALALGESLGMRPLMARSVLGLGALYHDAGDVPRARAALADATAALTGMEMSLWLAQALERIAALH